MSVSSGASNANTGARDQGTWRGDLVVDLLWDSSETHSAGIGCLSLFG